jgi:hypothetical protein
LIDDIIGEVIRFIKTRIHIEGHGGIILIFVKDDGKVTGAIEAVEGSKIGGTISGDGIKAIGAI